MKNIKIYIASALLLTTIISAFSFVDGNIIENKSNEDEFTVVSYYFPNYHEDKRNASYHGKGWTEWELIKEDKAGRENGHIPNVPAWGYTDEANPIDMAQKIDAAADNGIDVFLFDWYMYEDGPYLDRAIDEGFLKAENKDKIKYAFMWANHDWVDIHPYKKGKEQKLLYPGMVSPERYEEIGEMLIEKYFTDSNYWKIDGKAYFSIYDINNFIKGFGSFEATRKAMERLDAKAKKAGLAGIHWNLVSWEQAILPVEKKPVDNAKMVDKLGFNSVTSYVWVHHVQLPDTITDYNYVRDEYIKHWDKAKTEFDVPYYPNVTMGWDATPRCDINSEWENVGYPFMNAIGNNTPENFKKALEITKDKLLQDPNGPRIMNINCWNEWTEGSYLEPDEVNGMGYLEAIKEIYN